MMFDVVLPSVVFLCASSALGFFLKYEKRIKSEIEGEFRCQHAILAAMAIGLSVCTIALIPEQGVMLAFLLYFGFLLFKLAHVFTKKLCLSIIAPAVFAGLYLFSWNTLLMNIFSMTTIVFSTAMLSASFTRETKAKPKSIINRKNILSGLALFVTLLVLADATLVFGTNLMETAARKIAKLQIPLLVIMPTFPSAGGHVILGLGDIFLSGLLGIVTAKKMGRKTGVLCILSISATVLLGETIMLNFNAGPFPATILVVTGWLVALGMRRSLCIGET